MTYLRRRLIAALTGACTALFVFGVAFAAAPAISPETGHFEPSVYAQISELDEEDLQNLMLQMELSSVRDIESKLVEDMPCDVVMAYLQMHPDFEDTLIAYLNNQE